VIDGHRSTRVRLASLPVQECLDIRGVRLDDIWIAAGLRSDLAELGFDLVGEGGYRPSMRGCPPIGGTLLTRGWLVVDEGRVEWEPSANLGCQYRVKGLTMIVAQPLERMAAASSSADSG
jgi:hypothetical protein